MILETAKKMTDNNVHLEDVLFNGIYRKMAGVDKVRLEPGICNHFSDHKGYKFHLRINNLVLRNF